MNALIPVAVIIVSVLALCLWCILRAGARQEPKP